MIDLILVRTRNNPARRIKKNSDSGSLSGRRMPPWGILSIAGYCRQRGHSVKIFDLFRPAFDGLSLAAIRDQILSHNPRVVGISSMTSQCLEAMALGDALMQKSDAIVIHGGVHPAALPEEALKHGHIVVQGEGECCMDEILSSEHIDLDNNVIRGVPLTADEMDSIPFPKKLDFEETAFDPSLDPFFPLITARGCPYRCVFCKDGMGLRSSRVRYHSVDYVVDYIDYIHRTYGFRKLSILDDIFVTSAARLEDMATKLEERNLKFNIECQVHANVVKPELMSVMKRLGIRLVYIGIESGNERILKNIRKGTTIEKIEKAVYLMKKHGFYVAGLYMIGNIGETAQTINDTIRFALSLPTDRAWFSYAAPYPSTPFYEMVPQYGEIIEPDFGKWNQATIVYLPKGITRKTMKRLMMKAQMVRAFKKINHTLFGYWKAPIRRFLSKT